MRIEYNKLIRDHIPEIIEQSGKEFAIETMNEDEFQKALFAKLIEESIEASESENTGLIKEIADILEVIDAILINCEIEIGTVLDLQTKRRLERGGFEKKLKLLWTE